MSGANINLIEKRLERLEKKIDVVTSFIEDVTMTKAQHKRYLSALAAIRSGKAKKWVRAEDFYKELNK